jgi:peptidoglycan/LPS O-acetylase OafA/YrhL
MKSVFISNSIETEMEQLSLIAQDSSVQIEVSSSNSQSPTLTYRPELDGLRAIAVLSVVFYHAGFKIFQGGFVGVDIFFVLSGFLMTSIIVKELKQDRFTLLAFYERRIRRILPMLFFTIIVSFFPARRYLVTKDFIFFIDSALLSSIGLSNFLYSTTTKGYFDTNTDFIPLVHTWTLAVEEQFYLIIPVLFLTLWKLGLNFVLITLSVISLISFALTFHTSNEILNFYMLYTRFWELAIGSFIVFARKQNKSEIISFVGQASILTAVFGFDESMSNPSYFTLLPTVGTALFILYTDNNHSITGRVLSKEPFIHIGLVSYSAYLIHQPLFAFSRLQSLKPLDSFTFIFLILIVFGLSFVTWKFVESPFRNKKNISFQAIISLIAVYFIVFAFYSTQSLLSIEKDSNFMPEQQPILNNNTSVKLTMNNTVNTNKSLTNLDNTNKTVPNRVYTQLPNEKLFWYTTDKEADDRCHTGHNTANPVPNICRIGMDKISRPIYFLFGDSFAKALETAFTEHDAPGMYASFNGISCSSILNPSGDMGGHRPICQSLRKAVYEFIKNETSIKVLFIASRWSLWRDYIAANINYTVNAYAALGVRVVIVQQPSEQSNHPLQVYKNLLNSGQLTDENLRKNSATRKSWNDLIRDTEAIFKNYVHLRLFTYICIQDLLCDDEFCTIGTGTTPIWFDNTHLTTSAARLLKKRLISQI